MNRKKQFGSLFLILLLLMTPLTPAFAVEEDADSTAVEQTVSDTDEQTDTDTDSEESDDEDNDDSDAADEDDTDADSDDEDDSSADAAEADDEEDEEPDLAPTISINAGASICVNAETGEIIHENNAKEKMYPASTTKIMTALLVLENCDDLSETVTMQESDFSDVENGASTAGLQVGETVTVETLLYCMLLPSGNEAANALARYIGGDVDSFVSMMNARAEKLGCVNTHFMNANGLHDDDHYSCAYDLYLMAQADMQFEAFQTIVNTAQKKLPATNMQEERIIYTTNELIRSQWSTIYYDNCYGIKTGHTTPAGYCFVSYAKDESRGLSYYSVVLDCDFDDSASYAGSFVETKALFEWAFSKFSLKQASASGDPITECRVRLGKVRDSITLVTAEDVSVLIPRDADVSMLDVAVDTQDSYDAPIRAGDVLGTVTYSYNGTELASTDLVALTDVERSQLLFYLDQIKNVLRSSVFLAAVIVILILLVLLLVIRAIFRRRKRRRRLRQANKKRRK